MRRLLASIILLTAPALVAGNPEEPAVRALVQQYMDARNHRDAAATRSLFTDDADQLVSTGEWRRGIEALLRGAMASSQKEAGTSTITVEAVRFVTSDVAIADGRYETTTANGSTRKMWTTVVAKRTDKGWRIAAIRNMLPAAASH